MAGLISEAQAPAIRSALGLLLVHQYTRTPVTSGTDTTYGPTPTEGTPVTGVACKYRVSARMRLDDGNRVTVNTPTLTVASDDPLKVGDLVSNVTDSSGVVLLVGPIAVETIEPSAGLGPTLQKRAVLRGGDVV